jgi:hypothetical protein
MKNTISHTNIDSRSPFPSSMFGLSHAHIFLIREVSSFRGFAGLLVC